jgi:hypothetical protein
VLTSVVSGSQALESTWTAAAIDAQAASCKAGTLDGNYGKESTAELVQALLQLNVSGASVLVIGSERPWVEACLLSLGARLVTTLEYGSITSTHPRVRALTPGAMRSAALSYMGSFDAVASYSSLEHSGLGRYGDAMNPWGDRLAMARAWCLTRPGGRVALGVPGGDDRIEYNLHRVYGPVQLPHMFANWKQIWRSSGTGQHTIWVAEK